MCRTCTRLALFDCPPTPVERPAGFDEDLGREIDIDARVRRMPGHDPSLSGCVVLALRRFFGPPPTLDVRAN